MNSNDHNPHCPDVLRCQLNRIYNSRVGAMACPLCLDPVYGYHGYKTLLNNTECVLYRDKKGDVTYARHAKVGSVKFLLSKVLFCELLHVQLRWELAPKLVWYIIGYWIGLTSALYD